MSETTWDAVTVITIVFVVCGMLMMYGWVMNVAGERMTKEITLCNNEGKDVYKKKWTVYCVDRETRQLSLPPGKELP